MGVFPLKRTSEVVPRSACGVPNRVRAHHRIHIDLTYTRTLFGSVLTLGSVEPVKKDGFSGSGAKTWRPNVPLHRERERDSARIKLVC